MAVVAAVGWGSLAKNHISAKPAGRAAGDPRLINSFRTAGNGTRERRTHALAYPQDLQGS